MEVLDPILRFECRYIGWIFWWAELVKWGCPGQFLELWPTIEQCLGLQSFLGTGGCLSQNGLSVSDF